MAVVKPLAPVNDADAPRVGPLFPLFLARPPAQPREGYHCGILSSNDSRLTLSQLVANFSMVNFVGYLPIRNSRRKTALKSVFLMVFRVRMLDGTTRERVADSQFLREPPVSRFSARLSGRFSIPRERNSPADKPDAGRKHPKSGRGKVHQKGGSDPPFWAALRPRPSGLRGSLPPSVAYKLRPRHVARVHGTNAKPVRPKFYLPGKTFFSSPD